MLVAGSTVRELRVESEGLRGAVQVGWFEARQMKGYGEAFSVLDSLVRAMSGDAWRAAPNSLPPEALTALAPVPG